jgi:peroxiredoxin
MKRCLPGFFVFLLALSIGGVCAFAQGTDKEKKKAPPFEATTLAGKTLKLEELKGKYVVLNFWFINCPPCLNEIPQLNKLVTAYGKGNFVFIGFARDSSKRALSDFLAHKPFTYQIVPKNDEVIKNYSSEALKIMRYPTHIIIDPQGEIEFRAEGASALMPLQKELKRLAALKAALKPDEPGAVK